MGHTGKWPISDVVLLLLDKLPCPRLCDRSGTECREYLWVIQDLVDIRGIGREEVGEALFGEGDQEGDMGNGLGDRGYTYCGWSVSHENFRLVIRSGRLRLLSLPRSGDERGLRVIP